MGKSICVALAKNGNGTDGNFYLTWLSLYCILSILVVIIHSILMKHTNVNTGKSGRIKWATFRFMRKARNRKNSVQRRDAGKGIYAKGAELEERKAGLE